MLRRNFPCCLMPSDVVFLLQMLLLLSFVFPYFLDFLPYNEFWPFFGPPSPLTFQNVKNHGGGSAEGEPGRIARERRTKENKRKQRKQHMEEKTRQTEKINKERHWVWDKGDRGGAPKMAKIQYGVKPDIFLKLPLTDEEVDGMIPEIDVDDIQCSEQIVDVPVPQIARRIVEIVRAFHGSESQNEPTHRSSTCRHTQSGREDRQICSVSCSKLRPHRMRRLSQGNTQPQ